jgi:hypothetical protein
LLARVGLHYRDVFIVSALARALPLLAFVPVFAGVKRQLAAARE